MLDRVFIRGLQVETVIGVFDWERKVRQVLQLDIDMLVDIAAAASKDSLDLTVDYSEVARQAVSHIQAQQYQLIETVAESVARLILQDDRVKGCGVTVHKPGALMNTLAVGVSIWRGEEA